MDHKNTKPKIQLWLTGWLAIILLGVDFYNWGKVPRLILGMPDWVWFEVGLILLTSLIFGFLSRHQWEDK
ncbi:hypothetical protein [Bellilinea caldifistulae]|uniref:Uncharacterized protein n=1 Tax=Bellilinea caldifistulae TaxID=360411 RepID=A0A0P6XUP2_9CHLR|nr:hypothetical protein [Bellilinea caldifistulae]KPL77149.1 hypothetical protein AC812_04040 [Bellilinea caldifistulae]